MNQKNPSETVGQKQGGISFKKKAFFIFLAIVFFLVATEIVLQIVYAVENRDQGISFPAFLKSPYKDVPWRFEFFQNIVDDGKANTGKAFERYVGFTSREFKSAYVNVDSENARYTWNPPTFQGKPFTIYGFGGSAMGGGGERDEYTIPSFMSKTLNEKYPKYEVRNYAVGGYVFTQDVIKLILLLRSGHRPDFVVFYDGSNDVAAAYDAGEAGAWTDEDIMKQKLAAEFNPQDKLFMDIKQVASTYCKTCRIVMGAARSLFGQGALRAKDIKGFGIDDAKLQNLADGVAGEYLKSLKLVDDLSKTYGFRYAAFWQPTMFGDKKRLGYEEELAQGDWRLQTPNMVRLHDLVRDRLAKAAPKNFYDLKDAFAARTIQVFFDDTHVTEDGAKMAGEAIVKILKEKYGI